LLVDELGPAGASELSDSLSLAFLVVLEELSALERAAFLLHDVFGYGYVELSAALVRDQAACRQLWLGRESTSPPGVVGSRPTASGLTS
jgi:DNA-directed RNA polymerase specialized sigma24 family protein